MKKEVRGAGRTTWIGERTKFYFSIEVLFSGIFAITLTLPMNFCENIEHKLLLAFRPVPVQETLLVSGIGHKTLLLQLSDGFPQMFRLDGSFVVPLFHNVTSCEATKNKMKQKKKAEITLKAAV